MYYKWTKRIPIKSLNSPLSTSYKRIAVKTNDAKWNGTKAPVVILFSVHSTFNEHEKGALKVKTLMSTIKEQVRGPITVLLTEKAHLNVLALQHDGYENALSIATADAQELANKFSQEFKGCSIEYWQNFITKDQHYQHCHDQILQRYSTDTQFKELLYADAEKTYTQERSMQFPHKNQYIEHTVKDILEQCVYLLVIAKKGFRFEFYPGRQYDALHYINTHLVQPAQLFTQVHMDISFEKR